MPRAVDSAHRGRLVDAVAHDLLGYGLTGASLDRLATSAGTSARMLVHHFGSRQALINAALDRARESELVRARTELAPGRDYLRVLAGAWPWFSSDEAHQYFRLFGQVAAVGRLGAEEQLGVPRSQLTTEWLTIVADGFVASGCRPRAAHRLATVVIAQVRGLLLDLDATGAQERIGRAYGDFIALLAHSPDLPRAARPTAETNH